MPGLIKAIFIIVTLGIGATLLPQVKAVTTTIFGMFGGAESMPPFLALIVSFWPLIIAAGFVVGAVYIARGRA